MRAEQVQIEGRGDAGGVVIGRQHPGWLFHQVRAQQQAVAGQERAAEIPQKLDGARALEIADGAAEKQNEKRLVFGGALG